MLELSRGSSYFLSGVMQGAKADGDGVEGTVNQDYRGQLKAAILSADSSASIIEPWDLVGAFVKETYAEGTPQSDMFRDDAHVAQAFEFVWMQPQRRMWSYHIFPGQHGFCS